MGGKVTPLEVDRYTVESFGSSHDSQDEYLVDLSSKDFGCSCSHWDYNLRPTWEALTAFKVGFDPLPELGCKHIQVAWSYQTLGRIAVFKFNDVLAAGEVTSAEFVNNLMEIEVTGRKGNTLKLKTNENKPCYFNSYEQADKHINQN